ncbi:MAG TPA: thrombospondin type 3 repeat-containing protein, partial [Kiritimatiellia bacterium]
LPPFASLASTGAAGVCTFIPQAGQEGSMYTVTFTATNGNGGDARTIAMVVTDVAPSNMLRNGDFESPTWSTTYFDYWTTWGSAGREPWAARAGSFGAYFPTWSAGSTAGAYQDLYYPPRGTYTFSLWVRLEPNISPVVLDLKLEWFNYNYSNLQPASVTSLMGLPRDGGWHHVFVTGTCTSTALAVMRPVLYAEWATPGSGPAALMFDDAALYSGAYVGVRSLANPGFEEAYLTSWRGSRWYATPENTSGGREPWAARSGTNGAAFYGWLQESNTFAAAVQQNLTPRPGTFIFSGWLKREMNFQPTNSELRLEWYDATFTNKVQPDTVRNIALTNDGLWHFVAVTGSCTAAGFRELRPTVAVQWNRNPTNWTAAGMLDDMQLSYIDHAWDSDGDGLPDWWELVRFNGVTSAMAGADNDGDSMNNAREFRAGTDPTDASSLFEVIEGVPLENGDVMISWSSQSGVTYRVERATNLLHGFSVFRAGIPATPPVNVFVDTNQAPQLKLYRICVE